jgi:hypothetical protein
MASSPQRYSKTQYGRYTWESQGGDSPQSRIVQKEEREAFHIWANEFSDTLFKESNRTIPWPHFLIRINEAELKFRVPGTNGVGFIGLANPGSCVAIARNIDSEALKISTLLKVYLLSTLDGVTVEGADDERMRLYQRTELLDGPNPSDFDEDQMVDRRGLFHSYYI